MKNFKKVISVVIALAMVISSFTAVSASKFADVADTASYAEAVGALAALGVVNGTEENGALVFKPENQVTRAEAATMIVGALNLADEAKASAGTSQFADVNTQAAWAAGYVNVGVAQGFIKGYDASTFGPLDNVTYAQLCVMLTSIAGYGEIAASRGGWPTGYTTTAAQFGMSKGISAAADTALTKGQVAVMIYNTLQVPMLGISEFNMMANSYEQLNGKGDSGIFKTLLSDKFGGYVANVMITETPANKAGLDTDEVRFDVLKAAWWNDEEVKVSDPTIGEVTLFEGVDVNAAHLATGTALFVENEDAELVMVYFGGASDKNTKEYAAADYVFQDDVSSSNSFAKKGQIKFGSQYVKLNKGEIVLYVNGVETYDVDEESKPVDFTIEYFENWMKQAQGTVRITETEVDDDITYTIFLTCYEIARVTSVEVDDDETVISITKNIFGSGIDSIVIDAEDVEDGKVTVAVKKNGAEATAEDIKKGDIIAFAANFDEVNDKDDLVVEGAIEILATDDTVSGVVKSTDEDDQTYTIDGTEYYVLNGFNEDDATKTIDFELDPFGRIFDMKVSATADKYAIVLQYEEDDDLILLLADGTKQVFDAADVDVNDTALKVLEAAAGAKDIADRVIVYTVRTRTGEFTGAKKATAKTIDGEYITKTKKLDGNKVTDGTLIIDAQKAVDDKLSKATNYEAYAVDSLAADTPYKGVSFGSTTDTTPFIILTAIDALYGEATRFALAIDISENAHDNDGDPCDEVVIAGSDEPLLFEDGLVEEAKLKEGNLFIYETGADGFVDTVYVVYDGYYAAKTWKAGKITTFDKVPGLKDKLADTWSYSLIDTRADFQFVHGVIVEVDNSSITFADYADKLTVIDTNEELDDADHKDGVVSYAFAEGLQAYVVDTEATEKKFATVVDVDDATSIKASNFDKFDQDEDGKFTAEEAGAEDMNAYANEAIAIIVDGDVVAIYVLEK